MIQAKYTPYNWPVPNPDPNHKPDKDDLDWLKIFQRFVILAVLRKHEAPEAHQKAVITRPYLQIPYENQLGAVRQVAQGLWNGSKCGAGLIYHELVSKCIFACSYWRLQLRDPDRPIDHLTYCGYGEICSMCHRRRGDRNGLHQYHVEGRPYDNDTFVCQSLAICVRQLTKML